MTLFRGSMYTLTAQVLGAASTALLGVYVARELGASGFGSYALALAVTMLVAPLADCGVSLAVSRALASEASSDRNGIYITGLAVKVVSAVLFGAAMYAIAPLASRVYGGEAALPVFRAAAVAVVGQTLLTFFWSTLIAERRGLLNLGIVGIRVSLEVVLTVGLLSRGHGAAAATIARGLAHCAAAAVAALVVARVSRSSRPTRDYLRLIRRAALPLAVVEISYAALYQVDVLMVGVFLTPAAVGIYQAPLRVMTPVTYVGIALASGLAPAVAQERDEVRRRTQVARVFAMVAFGEAVVAALIFARAGDLVAILGSDYHQSVSVLRLLTPYFFVAALAPVVSMLVTYVGDVRHRAAVGVSCLAINVVLDCVFIPLAGVKGAAIAADIAAVLYVAAHCWLVSQALGFRIGRLLSVVGRAAVAAPFLAALLLAGTRPRFISSLSVRFSFALAALGLTLFLLAVVVPREVKRLAIVGSRR